MPGAFIIDIEPKVDDRGFFARSVCVEEFASYGLNARFIQQSISWNPKMSTLRGLHYQSSSYEEEKLVRVTRGAVFDVIVDLRLDSPVYGSWFSTVLSADNHRQIYVPKGLAHGFQTLVENTEVYYEMTVPFQEEASKGIRWNDHDIGIVWPEPDRKLISAKDKNLPMLREIRLAEKRNSQ